MRLDKITPDPLVAGKQATEAKAPDPNRHPSGGTDAGAETVPLPVQVSGPQAAAPRPASPPVPMDVEGSISREQLQRRGLALTPGRAPSPSGVSEALRPQASEPEVPFAQPDNAPFSAGDTMSLDEIKNYGIRRL